MKIPSIKILAASVALMGIPGLVGAQVLVSDTVTQTELATMNAQLQADATYLQTGYNGNGLLPLLSSINDKLGKSNASEAQSASNADTAARARIYDQRMVELKAAGVPTQEAFKRACVAITSRMTSAQGHGAARGSSDAIRSSREAEAVIEERIHTPGTPTEKIADLVRHRQANGFCDSTDVKNGFPACSSAGAMPSADIRSSSLTLGATAAASDPTNGSLSAAQVAAAQAYIVNTLPMPPTIPSPAALETARGKEFLATLNRFTARGSSASTAMNNILASHRAVPLTVQGAAETSPMMKDWNARAADWATIFGPQVKYPTAPSERDMMRYEVFHYYVSPDYQRSISTFTGDAAGLLSAERESLKQQALTNRILFQLLQRQEDANLMLAQLVSQEIDPVTTESLNKASANANR